MFWGLLLGGLTCYSFQLGRVLQYALSNAPYSGLVGDRMVEWDCKFVVARVMELLIANRPNALARISHHYQNGQKLDVETAQRHVKGKRFGGIRWVGMDV